MSKTPAKAKVAIGTKFQNGDGTETEDESGDAIKNASGLRAVLAHPFYDGIRENSAAFMSRKATRRR